MSMIIGIIMLVLGLGSFAAIAWVIHWAGHRERSRERK